MIELSVLPYLEWEDDGGAAKRLYADAQTSISIPLASDMTEHPVESGGVVVDNYRPLPEEIAVTWFFTNTPTRGDLVFPKGSIQHKKLDLPPPPGGASIFTPGGLTQAIGGAIASLFADPPIDSVNVLAFDEFPDRLFDVFEILQDIRGNARLCTVKTSFGILDQMGLTSATPRKDQQTGNGCYVDLEFKRLRFATSDVTIALPLPLENRGQKKKQNAGAQGLKPKASEGPGISALAKMAGLG